MAGRAVDPLAFFFHRVEIRDRCCLALLNQETQHWAFERRPGTYPGGCTGAFQINRGAAAKIECASVGRPVLLVRAPSEFGRLQRFAGKGFARPGIHELVTCLAPWTQLAVPLG